MAERISKGGIAIGVAQVAVGLIVAWLLAHRQLSRGAGAARTGPEPATPSQAPIAARSAACHRAEPRAAS